MTEQEFSRQIEAMAKKDANKLAVFEKKPASSSYLLSPASQKAT